MNQGKFKKLKGLLYFTDGKGIYPVRMPAYDTAFVFVEGQYEDAVSYTHLDVYKRQVYMFSL